jgi:hypothetical protein
MRRVKKGRNRHKKGHPILQVAVYDTAESVNKIIELSKVQKS